MYPKLTEANFRLSNVKDDTTAALNSTLAIASVGTATLTMLETLLPAAAEEVARSSQGLTQSLRTLLEYVQSNTQPPKEVADAVSNIITGMQFEDRNTQIMENVVSILERYRSMLEEVSRNIENMQEGASAPGHNIAEAVENILSGIRLGDIRSRYIAALKKANVTHDHGHETAAATEADSNLVELF